MEYKISFSSFYAEIGAGEASRLVAGYVRSDGVVCSRVGNVPLEFDPETSSVYTRSSVQSAVLEIGYNRSDHLVTARVLTASKATLKPYTVYEHIEKMAPTAEKALALIELVENAYTEAVEIEDAVA